MPRVLWLNLDPGRSFASLARDHCLDLLPEEHAWLWDVAAPRGEALGPWPDWPRPVRPEELRDALDDLPEGSAVRPRPWILVSAPAALSPGQAETLAGVADWAAAEGVDLVLTLPPDGDPRVVVGQIGGALMVVQISHHEPLERLHAERLLMEWLEHPELGRELREWRRPAALSLALSARATRGGLDATARAWADRLPEVLAQVHSLLRGAGTGEGVGAGASAERLLTESFATVEALAKQTTRDGETGGEPADEAALADLRIPAPWFRRADLGDRLHAARLTFLAHLDHRLDARFGELGSAHQRLSAREADADARLGDSLRALSPVDIGLGAQGLIWLDAKRNRCTGMQGSIRARADALLASLGRDLHPECGVSEYRRRRLEEDERLDRAVSEARARAEQLPRRRYLALAWAATTALVSVPVIATRAPEWLARGPFVYLMQPPLWVPDLVWLLLPGLLLILGVLGFTVPRRRALGVAIAHVQRAASDLWRRQTGVIDDTFHYAGHVLALRRLAVLGEGLESLATAQESTRSGLAELRLALERQQVHYQGLGMDAALSRGAQGSGPGPILESALGAGPRPRDWVADLVRRLPNPGGAEVLVWDHRRNHPGRLQGSRLEGYHQADLRPLDGEGMAP